MTERVRRFVAELRGEPVERVQPGTRLSEDLGIYGDDGYELMVAFEKAFAVDMSDLRYGEHFGEEGIPLRVGLVAVLVAGALGWLWSWQRWAAAALVAAGVLYFAVRKPRENLHALRVSDLARAAEEGRWNYEYASAGTG